MLVPGTKIVSSLLTLISATTEPELAERALLPPAVEVICDIGGTSASKTALTVALALTLITKP